MRAIYVVATSVLLAACGSGAAAEAVRPEEPTANQALGEEGPAEGECYDVSRGAEPLVVDWKPEQRGELELAMREGIAVVRFSCDGIALVKGCQIPGEYGFLGMTRKEQLVRLSNADEVRANLPLSGASLGGELSRGSSLDIAIVLVGKQRTTWNAPSTSQLQGSCDGATHYVRGAMVGAFAMDTGSEAKVRAVAEVFGASAGGESQSKKSVTNRDGDLADCKKADPNADAPPPQCGAPVRLVLAPLAKGEPKPGGPAPEAARSCPEGLVLTEGKCAKPKAAESYQCADGDEAECAVQCERGHAGSCAELGQILLASAKHERAAKALATGCKGGAGPACLQLGRLEESGKGVAQDATAAVKHYQTACDAAVAEACRELGRAHAEGVGGTPKSTDEALTAYEKACNGGDARGCAAAAGLLEQKAKPDAGKLARLHARACHGGVAESCLRVGALYETGEGVGKNPVLAELSYRQACFRGKHEGCAHLGRLVYATQPDAAKRHFEMACNFREALGCAALVAAFGEKRSVVPDVRRTQALRQSCTRGNVRDCALLGLFLRAKNDPMAKQPLSRACTRGDKLSCKLSKP